MKSNLFLILMAVGLFAYGGYNAKQITAAPKPQGESYSADYVKYAAPQFAGGSLAILGLVLKRFGPRLLVNGGGKLFQSILEEIGKRQGVLPKAAASTAEPVDATKITLEKRDVLLSVVLTGDAEKDSVGLKKLGAVLEHFGSGGQQTS